MAPKYAMAIGRVRDKGFRVTKHKAPVKPSRRKGVQHKVRENGDWIVCVGFVFCIWKVHGEWSMGRCDLSAFRYAAIAP